MLDPAFIVELAEHAQEMDRLRTFIWVQIKCVLVNLS